MKFAKAFIDLFRTTFAEWNEDGAPRLAAALAYYTAFSLAPLIVIIVAVIGFVVSEDTVRNNIVQEISATVGSGAADFVQDLIDNVNQPREGIISTVLGIGALLFGALGLFTNLQASLDIMWDVNEVERKSGIQGFVKDKLLSFGMLLVVGFLLLVSLVLSTILSVLDTHFLSQIPASTILLRILNFGLSFGIITVLFALIYKYLPHAHIEWRDVWVGAAVTSLLFSVGKSLLGWYLGSSGTASPYGAAGAFVLILLWVYYSAQIVLFGAEFTQVYARRYGSKILPFGVDGEQQKEGLHRQPASARAQPLLPYNIHEKTAQPPATRLTLQDIAISLGFVILGAIISGREEKRKQS